MENYNIDVMIRQIAILEKKLQRSEHSRRLIEQAMDHYDLVYRSSIDKLDAQKNLLDVKNQELDFKRLELLAKNAELQEVSTTDGVTRIYNRRKINEIFNEKYLQAQCYKISFSVIIIDVDWFKLVNDTYGHQAGDQVLFELAQLMKCSLRTTEYIGRWGGEEFFIVLPNTSANDGYVLAERIRLKVSNHNFGTPKHLTCSFGITEYMKEDSIERIIKRADMALYQAKERRNCACIFK
ncbi:GGDEF domain-containing protein [Clostridium estertheticum]|uniref:GGDEF domain-containing protein n=2 Tax=Clostridium estertheticum TaxID=238834 RepID=A0A5N7IR95_9CLOT|nr:GGDEF domain-containing protein [Clostridium estertheticum]MBU3072811.1 GGDEF domain-containing protein [Clostridium estertheticum]MBU3163152.1 GGDEF domain-containing protein [Clostridium estertheticum]MPQ32838.1 GGDEF domain-containing protein [Clostridium estertheticum]MPQ63497.1 GGDEF domain-containing protein [Clostridium estertheticum]